MREQLESLLGQTYPEIEVLVRDDGSSDSTVDILEEYGGKYDCIHVFRGDNIGVAASFFELLRKSGGDYIAFCDQDDVWLPEKVARAVEKLRGIEGPVLYCGNKLLADADATPIAGSRRGRLRPGFGNAVIECICTGCTAVMNRELAGCIRDRLPEYAILHDWWCYLAASYVGQVVFDEEAYLLYRQHEGNVVGQSGSFLGSLSAKVNYLKKSRGKLRRQLTEFARLYHGQEEKDRIVQLLLGSEGWAGKLPAVLSRSYYRQSACDQWIVRALLLFNLML